MLAGYVRNMDDRRVLLEVEGEEEELKRFFGELDEAMKQFIAGRTIDRQPATGEFGQPRPGGLSIRF
jgi:acylphosphatase